MNDDQKKQYEAMNLNTDRSIDEMANSLSNNGAGHFQVESLEALRAAMYALNAAQVRKDESVDRVISVAISLAGAILMETLMRVSPKDKPVETVKAANRMLQVLAERFGHDLNAHMSGGMAQPGSGAAH